MSVADPHGVALRLTFARIDRYSGSAFVGGERHRASGNCNGQTEYAFGLRKIRYSDAKLLQYLYPVTCRRTLYYAAVGSLSKYCVFLDLRRSQSTMQPWYAPRCRDGADVLRAVCPQERQAFCIVVENPIEKRDTRKFMADVTPHLGGMIKPKQHFLNWYEKAPTPERRGQGME